MKASSKKERQAERPTQHVRIPPLGLEGLLRTPEEARGIVVFVHGSGSSRLSPRNNCVADALGDARLATLLFDLLTEEEAGDRANVFDIELLTERLLHALDWVKTRPDTRHLPVGLFGASTGAAAALVGAGRSRDVGAVVSRGGRPDLAGPALNLVDVPTLLIVGGLDTTVLELNRLALAKLGGKKDLQIVPNASHLFEEPGALDIVIALTRRWFEDHLRRPSP
jgi:pimeloyl-ACP methyl ester carboxylesterase